jgi:phenylacetate-CoA ligase
MTNFPRLFWYLTTSLRRLHWNSQKLRKYQEKRLRSVIKYAYEFVPFYHDRFKQVGITPDDIKTIDDLAKLPPVTKTDMKREPYRRLVSSEYDMNKLKIVQTSGSSGQPFQVYINKKEDDWRKSIYMRANIVCGQKPRDRWVVLTSPTHFNDTTNAQRKLGIYAQTVVSVFNSIDDQVRLIQENRADVLDGYSGSLFLLAREVDRRSLHDIRPRIIFGSAELIDSVSREYMEKVFAAPFYDQFGCTEMDRTAWQCKERKGYHMDEDSVIFQFVDSNGNDVSAGERGEIVYTSLFNFSMPFIRYAVGDIGVPSDEKCSCGIKLPLMEVVDGRKNSFLILPDGRLMSPNNFTTAVFTFKDYNNIDQFKIVQKKPDVFEVYIKKKDNDINEEFMKTELLEHLKKTLNLNSYDINFDIQFHDSILLNKSGKLGTVYSELEPSL